MSVTLHIGGFCSVSEDQGGRGGHLGPFAVLSTERNTPTRRKFLTPKGSQGETYRIEENGTCLFPLKGKEEETPANGGEMESQFPSFLASFSIFHWSDKHSVVWKKKEKKMKQSSRSP
jgi:hypothetical protein